MKDVQQDVGCWKEGDGEDDVAVDNFDQMKHSTAGTNALFKTDIAESPGTRVPGENWDAYSFQYLFYEESRPCGIPTGHIMSP